MIMSSIRVIYKALVFRRLLPTDFAFYMIWNKNAIFIQIPKTAGTSIRNTLHFYPTLRGYNNRFDQHQSVRDVIRLAGQEKLDNSFSFTFVRNPWARVVSMHRFSGKQGYIDKDMAGNFEAYVDMICNFTKTEDPEKKLKKHFYPQVDWLKDNDGNIKVDFIGRFENLHDDFDRLCEALGEKGQLKKLNVAWPPMDYRECYTDELIEKVGEYYKEDIDYFGYSF